MVVIVLERVPVALRGELTRWLLEPKAGVFVGRPSAMVRDKLWDMIGEKMKSGAAVMIFRSNTEQGFTMRTLGKTSRAVIDFEGLSLIQM